MYLFVGHNVQNHQYLYGEIIMTTYDIQEHFGRGTGIIIIKR